MLNQNHTMQPDIPNNIEVGGIYHELRELRKDIQSYIDESIDKSLIYLTINDVMEIYGVTRPTIYKWLDDGLQIYRKGGIVRINQRELETYLKFKECWKWILN